MYIVDQNIRKLRSELSLTQKQLAKKIDSSQQVISAIERGRLPDLMTLCKIGEYFDVTIDDLLYDTNICVGSKKKIKSKNLLKLLNEDERQQVTLMIEFLLYKNVRNK